MGIFTDSILNSILAPNISQVKSQLVVGTIAQLNLLARKANSKEIKAHAGLTGNERADGEARLKAVLMRAPHNHTYTMNYEKSLQ